MVIMPNQINKIVIDGDNVAHNYKNEKQEAQKFFTQKIIMEFLYYGEITYTGIQQLIKNYDLPRNYCRKLLANWVTEGYLEKIRKEKQAGIGRPNQVYIRGQHYARFEQEINKMNEELVETIKQEVKKMNEELVETTNKAMILKNIIPIRCLNCGKHDLIDINGVFDIIEPLDISKEEIEEQRLTYMDIIMNSKDHIYENRGTLRHACGQLCVASVRFKKVNNMSTIEDVEFLNCTLGNYLALSMND